MRRLCRGLHHILAHPVPLPNCKSSFGSMTILPAPVSEQHACSARLFNRYAFAAQWTNVWDVLTCTTTAHPGSPLPFHAFVPMPLTRHPVRSSFTFEIKRAHRRLSEVVTITKTSSRGTSLAEEVFGTSTPRPGTRRNDPDRPPLPPTVDRGDGIAEDGFAEDVVSSPRRVLPDLTSPDVDPVAERMQRLAEERVVRRRSPHKSNQSRAKESSGHSVEPITTPLIVPDLQIQSEDGVANAAALNPTTAHRQRSALRRTAMRAERLGQPQPRLPAGQRWKRRLPAVCW
jgi:hypothetical protein